MGISAGDSAEEKEYETVKAEEEIWNHISKV